MTPAGLEPAIPGSVGRCLIHWATGPLALRSFAHPSYRSEQSRTTLRRVEWDLAWGQARQSEVDLRACLTEKLAPSAEHLWSSGYDVSLTR